MIITAIFRWGMKASERQSDLPKVMWLFDAGMRRGGKERLKKKKKESWERVSVGGSGCQRVEAKMKQKF